MTKAENIFSCTRKTGKLTALEGGLSPSKECLPREEEQGEGEEGEEPALLTA